MSRATDADQLRFLLSCVKWANSGKVNFDEVARECDIVSKGAAAKRYERLLKSNGIHPSGGPPPSQVAEKLRASVPTESHQYKESSKASPSDKKRKVSSKEFEPLSKKKREEKRKTVAALQLNARTSWKSTNNQTQAIPRPQGFPLSFLVSESVPPQQVHLLTQNNNHAFHSLFLQDLQLQNNRQQSSVPGNFQNPSQNSLNSSLGTLLRQHEDNETATAVPGMSQQTSGIRPVQSGIMFAHGYQPESALAQHPGVPGAVFQEAKTTGSYHYDPFSPQLDASVAANSTLRIPLRAQSTVPMPQTPTKDRYEPGMMEIGTLSSSPISSKTIFLEE